MAGLDTSLPKSQLREALFYRFSRYGQVVDVVCMKRQRRLRGQAWVVFSSSDQLPGHWLVLREDAAGPAHEVRFCESQVECDGGARRDVDSRQRARGGLWGQMENHLNQLPT